MPRTLAGFLAGVLLAASLVACADGEGPEIPRPTRTPTGTPSIDLPTPTRTPSRTPESSESQEPTPEPTDEPTPEVEPTDEPTDEPTLEVEPTDDATDEPTDEPAEDDTTDESDPTWLWWLLGALVLGAAIGIPLLVRSRRRDAWRAELAEAEGELVWAARELLPGLRTVGSREQVAGGWAVAAPRVAAAEDRLTVLESSAYDDISRARAVTLRDAARQTRQRMDRIAAPGPHDTWALDLDAVMLDLETALGPPAAPPA